MNLAFYYHVPISKSELGVFLPEYLGRFIQGLNVQVNQLYLIAHSDLGEGESQIADDIVIIDLGIKKNSLHRSIFSKKTLQPVFNHLADIDAFLIRSPSPLAPAFSQFRKYDKQVFYYVVGDYLSGAHNMVVTSLRTWAIKTYLKWNHKQFMKAIKNHKTLVNSYGLKEKLVSFTNQIVVVPTTTLVKNDLYIRNREFKAPYKILYTGRFDFQKGLRELIDAFGALRKRGVNVELHFVGWEDGQSVETYLRNKAKDLGMTENVFFHGKKKVGEELNQMYRMADIYCIPSYHEGFPRTIWEAGANQLPVIATKVGGIPHIIEDGKHAILIPPKDSQAIAEAVLEIIHNDNLRILITNQLFEMASENVTEIRSKEIVQLLKNSMAR